MNIDDRIYKVCQNAEYEFSKSQKIILTEINL